MTMMMMIKQEVEREREIICSFFLKFFESVVYIVLKSNNIQTNYPGSLYIINIDRSLSTLCLYREISVEF